MKTKTRVISLLLTACMMLSLCAALPFVASAEVVSPAGGWDGKKATQPAGSGTKDDPYLIADAANLLWVQKQIPAADKVNDSHADVVAGKYTAKFAGMYFLQTQDIDLNGQEFASIGYYFANAKRMGAFGGTYDGQGYAIRNGKIVSQNTGHELRDNMNWGHGLFGMIYGATIKNIVLDNVQVEGYGITGAIVGRAVADATTTKNQTDNGKKAEEFNIVENCVVNANCTLIAKYPTNVKTAQKEKDEWSYFDKASRAGGIVGMTYGTTVRYCVNNGTVKVPANWVATGGIVGAIGYNTKVEYCVNAGTLTYDMTLPFDWKSDDGTALYPTKSAENAIGGIVGYIAPYYLGKQHTTLIGNAEIANCYNTGKLVLNAGTNTITTPIFFGGILGGANTLFKGTTNTITSCYNLFAIKKGENGIPATLSGNTYRIGGLLGSYWTDNLNKTKVVNGETVKVYGDDVDFAPILVKNSQSVTIDANAYTGSNTSRFQTNKLRDDGYCVRETDVKNDTAENIMVLTNAIDAKISEVHAAAIERKVVKVSYQNETTAGSTAVRFSAQILGNEYERVGFKIWASYSDGTVSAAKEITLHSYYTSLKADNANVTPDEGYYFIAFVIDEIPTDKGDVTFTMVPYVVDLNGSVSYGNTATVTFPVSAGE
ncbi:MAG TPA: hypothetical protein DDW30_05615 [Clostridiales bacterium]|nr:hypothetical protein [Clostridiales bacterium]